MEKPDYSSAIHDRVKRAKAGSVFAMVDFADLAPNNAANRVVTRLAAEGVLLPVLRGIYQKQKYSTFLGEYVMPIGEDVVDSAAPVTIPITERLRFADAGVPVAFNVLDEQIDSFQNLFVLKLPARVLIPCARRECEVYGPFPSQVDILLFRHKT